jgi:hypothetical protein
LSDIPYTWSILDAELAKGGCDEARREALKVGFMLGYHAALVQLGSTSTPQNMAMVWKEYMDAAQADAEEAHERSRQWRAKRRRT